VTCSAMAAALSTATCSDTEDAPAIIMKMKKHRSHSCLTVLPRKKQAVMEQRRPHALTAMHGSRCHADDAHNTSRSIAETITPKVAAISCAIIGTCVGAGVLQPPRPNNEDVRRSPCR
jgi:hypothetical protein